MLLVGGLGGVACAPQTQVVPVTPRLDNDLPASDPMPGDPQAGDPTTGDPVLGDPAAGDPAEGDPATGDPATGDPAAGDPAAGDPAAGDPAVACEPPWWNAAWAWRRQISVEAVDALPAGYTLELTVDHAALIDQGLATEDGADLRLVRWDGAGWTELNRVLAPRSAWQDANTRLRASLDTVVAAGETATDLFLYYANPSAPPAPADPTRVYAFFDDFEGGTLDRWVVLGPNAWTVDQGQAVSGTHAARLQPIDATVTGLAATGLQLANLRVEAFWYFSVIDGTDVSLGGRSSTGTPFSAYETNLEGTGGWDLAKWIADTWIEVVDQPAGQSPQVGVWTHVALSLVGTRARVEVNGARVIPTNGWYDLGSEIASGSVHLGAYHLAAGQACFIDDVAVSRAVQRTPTVSLGAAEPAGCR